jgi:hypothetical protein
MANAKAFAFSPVDARREAPGYAEGIRARAGLRQLKSRLPLPYSAIRPPRDTSPPLRCHVYCRMMTTVRRRQ